MFTNYCPQFTFIHQMISMQTFSNPFITITNYFVEFAIFFQMNANIYNIRIYARKQVSALLRFFVTIISFLCHKELGGHRGHGHGGGAGGVEGRDRGKRF